MSYAKTKKYKTSDIVKAVEICMDEIGTNDAEFDSGQDDTERATIIASKIPEALRFVVAHADMTLLDPDTVLTTATVTGSVVKKATVVLPDNFLRLVYAKYPSWMMSQGEEDLVEWRDTEYPMLIDAYVGGTKERPRIAIVWGGTDNESKMLELYPAVNSETPIVGIMTEPEEKQVTDASGTENGWEIAERCYRAVIYYIAGLTYVTYADQARSAMMFEQANDIIGFTEKANIASTNN